MGLLPGSTARVPPAQLFTSPARPGEARRDPQKPNELGADLRLRWPFCMLPAPGHVLNEQGHLTPVHDCVFFSFVFVFPSSKARKIQVLHEFLHIYSLRKHTSTNFFLPV